MNIEITHQIIDENEDIVTIAYFYRCSDTGIDNWTLGDTFTIVKNC